MNPGRWYLVYTHTNEMEADMFDPVIEDVKIVLRATTESEAVTEAKSKWDEIETASKARWEEQRRMLVHPPASPTERGPRDPRVIYKIPLQ